MPAAKKETLPYAISNYMDDKGSFDKIIVICMSYKGYQYPKISDPAEVPFIRFRLHRQ